MLSQQINAIGENEVRKVCGAFSLPIDEIKLLGNMQNLVFSVNNDSIVRFTHASHRDESALLGEYEYVEHLVSKGVDAPKAYRLSNGDFFIPIERNNEKFFASATAKAHGAAVSRRDKTVYTERLFKVWGRTMGAMHEAVKDFHPAHERFDYYDDGDLKNGAEALKNRLGEETATLYTEALNKLKALEKDEYGTVHYDLHSGNFFFDGKHISIFDFDDCVKAHFIGDIAVALYSHTSGFYRKKTQREMDEFAREFMLPFLGGYKESRQLPDSIEKLLPTFMLHRFFIIAIFLIKEFDSDDAIIKNELIETQSAIEYWQLVENGNRR